MSSSAPLTRAEFARLDADDSLDNYERFESMAAHAKKMEAIATTGLEMLAALRLAEQELEANKVAMVGPEWAAQRTATGGALLAVSRAIMKAEGKL